MISVPMFVPEPFYQSLNYSRIYCSGTNPSILNYSSITIVPEQIHLALNKLNPMLVPEQFYPGLNYLLKCYHCAGTILSSSKLLTLFLFYPEQIHSALNDFSPNVCSGTVLSKSELLTYLLFRNKSIHSELLEYYYCTGTNPFSSE
jgi:hypothetical protein